LVITKLWRDGDDSVIPGEIEVIKACLIEETSAICPPSPSSARRLSKETLNNSDEINTVEWMEPEKDFPPFEIKTAPESCLVTLPHGLTRAFNNNKCYATGLSPNCCSVYFLREKDIIIYSLENFPKVTEFDILLKRAPRTDEDYKDTKAALTNRFLAVLSRGNPHRLSIYEHGAPKTNGKDIDSEILDMWHPTCISMYEARNRTWVAIGGHSARDGHISLYRIEDSHGKLRLKKHDAQFEKCIPNALLNDWPKVISFSPDGRRLTCVTKNKNKVLVWFLSNNARPRQAAFEIMKQYDPVSSCPSKRHSLVYANEAVSRGQ
jgi:hypothetical protein